MHVIKERITTMMKVEEYDVV